MIAAGTPAYSQARLSSFDAGRLNATRHIDRLKTNSIAGNGVDQVTPLPLMEKFRLNIGDDNAVDVLLTVNTDTDNSLLEAAGLTDYSHIGQYYFGRVSLDNVERLAGCDGVKTIELDRQLEVRNDRARAEGNLADVQTGLNLPSAYNGEGVIVALVDLGLDPNHVTFTDGEGNTRVKRLWNIAASGKLKSYTDETIGSFSTDNRTSTHGTHVLGTITGSCTTTNAGNDFHGVAPAADIAISCGDISSNSILKGVELITEYAKEQGKPCVINISIGDNYGPHDGTDTFTAALNEFAAKDGVTIFMAAGNEGEAPISLVKEFTEGSTSVQTILENNASVSNSQALGFIDIWGSDERPLKLFLDLYENNDLTTPVKSYEIPANGHYHLGQGETWQSYIEDTPVLDDELFNTHYKNSLIGGYANVDEANNRFHVDMIAHLVPTTKFVYSSTTRFGLRVEGEPGQKVFIYTPMQYLEFTNKGKKEFMQGGGDGCISNMGSGRETISVGSYCTRKALENIYGPCSVGEISAYSSWGKLVDGRLLPDICAPGQVITSATNYYYAMVYRGYVDQTTVKKNNVQTPHYWSNLAGTSMASPYVTGVGALMLSADPTLTTAQIREIMQTTATIPENKTGQWGASGKLNAYAAVKEVINRLNHGGISGVTDNARGGITIQHMGGNTYEALSQDEASLRATVCTLTGSTVRTLTSDSNEIAIDLEGMASGVYILTVEGARGRVSSKIIIR